MSGIQVGDTEWTTAELAERGVPCVCGHHPDDHEHDEPVCDCPCPDNCTQYQPDVEALCPDCDGTGGYTTDTYDLGRRALEVDHDCPACDATGLKAHSRWVS